MSDKIKKAEYLFSEIGGIDDRIIVQAMKTKGRKAVAVRRVVSLLVAAVLIVSMMLGGLVVAQRMKSEDNAVVDSISLDSALSSAEESGRTVSYSSSEQIDLFDGMAKIVWSEGEDYHVINIRTESEKRRLDSALRHTYSLDNEFTESHSLEMSVWISYGDGRVISPYLKNSYGNVGYGELFDYEAEIIPSERLSELVNYLVS